ncbi:MAG: hypothetical protein ACE5HO_07340 [bacterium]
MAQAKVKGNIIYEILIVILSVLLIASIIYPKKVTDQEAYNQQICRDRMSAILNAELQYQKYNTVYTDSLPQLLDFIRTSDAYAHYVDSVLVRGLDSVATRLKGFIATEEMILADIPKAVDTTMIDSLGQLQQKMRLDTRQVAGYVEYLHDRMKIQPNMPVEKLREAFVVIDSKQFILNMGVVKNLVEKGNLKGAQEAAVDVIAGLNNMINDFDEVKAQIPQYKSGTLDSLYTCPTVHKTYKLVYIDTSAIKYLNIYCPIDSTDIAAAKSNFLKYRIGGLKLANHGHIEKGEKSWEQNQ